VPLTTVCSFSSATSVRLARYVVTGLETFDLALTEILPRPNLFGKEIPFPSDSAEHLETPIRPWFPQADTPSLLIFTFAPSTRPSIQDRQLPHIPGVWSFSARHADRFLRFSGLPTLLLIIAGIYLRVFRTCMLLPFTTILEWLSMPSGHTSRGLSLVRPWPRLYYSPTKYRLTSVLDYCLAAGCTKT
jgi:hypothetical protein